MSVLHHDSTGRIFYCHWWFGTLVILSIVQFFAMGKYLVCVYDQEPGPVSMETGCRGKDGHTSKRGKMASAQRSESSESLNGSCRALMITQPSWTNKLVRTQISLPSNVHGIWCCPGSSSDSDEMSLSDNDDDLAGPGIPACTPLAAFLSFKQEAEKRRASQVQLETPGKVVTCCRTIN